MAIINFGTSYSGQQSGGYTIIINVSANGEDLSGSSVSVTSSISGVKTYQLSGTSDSISIIGVVGETFTMTTSAKSGFNSQTKIYTITADVLTKLINLDYRKFIVYGICIDESNSNPLTATTYTDDAILMVKGSSDWDSKDIFKDIKPCVLKNPTGVVNYYLNPNNFALQINGVASDITSGNAGDVMIEFSKFAYLIYRIDNFLYIKISNAENAMSLDARYGYNLLAETQLVIEIKFM